MRKKIDFHYLQFLLVSCSLCFTNFPSSAHDGGTLSLENGGGYFAEQQPNSISVQGKVVDADSLAIAGVSVHIKGTSTGTATSTDGRFALSFHGISNPILVFSFIGMETQEIAYHPGHETLYVVLKEDNRNIDDVVITGYANIRKEGFTGTATTVTKSDMLKVSPSNVMKALSAFDPSLKMITNNAMGSNPNNLSEYYIRGRSGISEIKELDQATGGDISEFSLKNNPSAPIFILDGFEVEMEKIYDMDMNRIESITILKDAAATAVYGSRAANGVIVIETTSPEIGEIRVNYSGTISMSLPDLSSYHLLNAREALEAEWIAGLYTSDDNAKAAAGLTNYSNLYNHVLRGIDTDWISKPLQNEFNHKHYLYIDGGGDALRWGVDVNYQHKGGIMKQSKRDTYGAALTLDYRYKSLQIKNKASVNIMNGQESPYGTFGDYVRMKPYLDPYNPEMESYYIRFPIYRLSRTNTTPDEYILNPLYEASLGSFDRSEYREFIDNLSINWRINSYWMLKGTLGISYKVQDSAKFVDPSSGAFYGIEDLRQKGTYTDGEIRTSKWNLNAFITYNRSIGKNNLNFALGVESAETKASSMSALYQGFVDGMPASPSNALEIKNKPTFVDSNSRRFGTYLQFNYTFDDIYLLDIAGRYEGSSVFGANKKMGTFYSGGVGLNLHNYAFMRNVKFVDRFKIKATYGQTGKANFSPYQARTTYTVLNDNPYIDQWGMSLKALGNEDLVWEKVNKLDIGTEIALLKNAVILNFDYYREKTVDQVEDVSVPSSSGFKTYKGNMGEVMNKGIDLRLNVRAFSNKDWDVYLFTNLNHNTNRITKIGEALQNYNKRIDEFFSNYGQFATDPKYSTPFTKYEVGNSLSAIYGMKSLGIDPMNGQELYVKRDGTVTYDWSSAEQQCLGDSDPKVSGTCGLNLRWKNWTLYTTFSYRWGGQAYNETLVSIENVNLERYSGDIRILTERWQAPGDFSTLKSIKDRQRVTRPTSRFVQDNNELVFNSLSIGYDFNRELVRKWGLSAIRIQFNMEDIATFSSIRQERGTSYPFARAFNISLNITL